MCRIVLLFDGTYGVRLHRSWVAFGIPDRAIAESFAEICNERLV